MHRIGALVHFIGALVQRIGASHCCILVVLKVHEAVFPKSVYFMIFFKRVESLKEILPRYKG